jgi:predicted DNA-binding transcriptional regulator AlpA
MGQKAYTTIEAAARVGISRATLQDWIRKKKCSAPELAKVANISVRLWRKSDIARLMATKKKIYQEKQPKK